MQNSNIQPRGSSLALLQTTLLLLLLISQAQAAVKTWDGSSSGNWATAANWTGNVAPVDGDDLVFPPGASNLVNTNNYTALKVSSIIFTGSGYTLRGNALTVTNGISGQQAAGANTVGFSLTLGAAQTFDCVTAGASQSFSHITNSGFALTFSGSGNLTAGGVISGSGGVTKNGAGTLTYSGLRNTYTGTTRVNRGTLALNCNAINDAFRGPLIISDGTGPAEVRLLLNDEIPNTTAVTVQAGGTLNLNNEDETVGNLTLQGGTVSSGTATLTLDGNITVLASSTTASINGNLAFTGGLRTISVADGAAFYDLNLAAAIRDAGGGLLFTNATPVQNFARLLGSNSFTGPLTVANIRLSAETPWALGATNGGTTVKTNATLWMFQTGITNEALTLEGGATWVGQNNCTWAGPVTLLNGTATLNVYPEANTLDVIGYIVGAGGCTKTGAGKLRYSGAVDNLYSGPTEVREGTLELNKSSFWWAIGGGSLTIGDGSGGANADVVRYVSAGTAQITSIPITINSSGLLDLNDHSDTVGPITMVGGAITTGTGVLTPGNITATPTSSATATIAGRLQLSATRTFEMLPGPVSPSLVVSATISGSGGLTKTGLSGLDLMASNSYSGLTVVSQGQLFVGDSDSLGATAGGTVVSNGAGLILSFGVNVGAESLSLAGEGVSSQGALWSANNATASWAGPITFASNTVIGVVGPSGKLTLSGTLSGAGGLTKVAEGTLVIAGGTDNTYDGVTTVRAGELHFNKTPYADAIKPYGPGLVVGDGTETATVRWLNNYQLWSVVTPVTVNRLGVLDLNGYEDTAAPLTLAGGQILTGAGRVRLAGTVTVQTNAQMATISGNAYLAGAVVITNAGHLSSPDLRINASISGGAGYGITKTGPGDVELMVSNSFSGPVTINNGELEIHNSWALGNTNTPVTVNSGGTLHLYGNLAIGQKPLVLNGPGWPGASFVGALAVSDGNSSWAGSITNTSDSTI
jgi:autotransporter-associated beta strand protein